MPWAVLIDGPKVVAAVTVGRALGAAFVLIQLLCIVDGDRVEEGRTLRGCEVGAKELLAVGEVAPAEVGIKLITGFAVGLLLVGAAVNVGY